TDHIGLDAARKAYEQVDTSTLAARVRHVVQCCFNGRRIVVFSGGEFGSDENALFDGIRGLRDGGANGSIIGRNTFQRPKEKALQMLDTIIKIYQGEA
ncbi:MAG: fructose-bisphosphate aldolase, partial [Acetobacteraceae bacterium]|nr:fructose-bisphosphate aldolase [Acetobacteraceae bacterium]